MPADSESPTLRLADGFSILTFALVLHLWGREMVKTDVIFEFLAVLLIIIGFLVVHIGPLRKLRSDVAEVIRDVK